MVYCQSGQIISRGECFDVIVNPIKKRKIATVKFAVRLGNRIYRGTFFSSFKEKSKIFDFAVQK